MNLFSASLSSVRKILKDTFNRSNQIGLGVASDGSRWINIKNSFNITSNKAEATTTDYPISAINMPTENNEISLFGISQGAAAALWITDAGNWWSIGVYQEDTPCNCQTCSNCEAYSGVNCSAYGVDSYNAQVTGVSGYNSTNYGVSGYNALNYSISGYNGANYGFIGYFGANYGVTGGENAKYGSTGGYYPVIYGINGGRNARYAKYSKNTWSVSGYNGANYGKSGGGTLRYGVSGYFGANYGVTGGQNARNGVTGGENARYEVSGGGNANYVATGGGNANYAVYSSSNPNYACVANNPNTCTSQYNYDCNCQTCYPQYIRLIQSVGSTVSTIYSWLIGTVVSSTIIQSLKVTTSNDSITVKSYSDPNLITQIGSDLVYTPTGVAVTTTYGISIMPSTYNQGYSIDGVEIKRTDL